MLLYVLNTVLSPLHGLIRLIREWSNSSSKISITLTTDTLGTIFCFSLHNYPVSFCIRTHFYGLTLFQNVCSLSIPKHFLLPHIFGTNSIQLRTLFHLSLRCFYSGFTQSKISSTKLLTPHSPAPHHTYAVGIDTNPLGWLLPSLCYLGHSAHHTRRHKTQTKLIPPPNKVVLVFTLIS